MQQTNVAPCFLAIVRSEICTGDTVLRQMLPLASGGGRGGKQGEFIVPFGLAGAAKAENIEVVVADRKGTVRTLRGGKRGRHVVDLGD